MKEPKPAHEIDVMVGTYPTYIVGFLLSLLFTFGAYFIVSEHWLTGWPRDLVVIILCLIQVFVQLIYFLHLGHEQKPYWNLQLFLFMVLVVAIIVTGTLWIMWNLDYRTMRL